MKKRVLSLVALLAFFIFASIPAFAAEPYAPIIVTESMNIAEGENITRLYASANGGTYSFQTSPDLGSWRYFQNSAANGQVINDLEVWMSTNGTYRLMADCTYAVFFSVGAGNIDISFTDDVNIRYIEHTSYYVVFSLDRTVSLSSMRITFSDMNLAYQTSSGGSNLYVSYASLQGIDNYSSGDAAALLAQILANTDQIIENQDRLYDFLYQPKYGFLEESYTLSTRYFNFSNYTSTYPYGSFTDTPKSSDLPFFQSFDGLVYAINFGAQPFSTGQIDTPVLVEGREYIVSFSFPADSGVELHHFSFNSMVQSISNLSYRTNFVANFGYLTTISFSFESPATTPILLLSFYMDNGSPISLVSGGYLMVSIAPVSDQQFADDAFEGSVNSGQSQITNDVQSSVGQLDDFDNEIFQNVSDYTAKLDFGLSSWADAAAGISYIGSIFLMIWNNSPTQVVVLSLMIGLCILLLGRGARVAGAIRRSHRDDDGGGG